MLILLLCSQPKAGTTQQIDPSPALLLLGLYIYNTGASQKAAPSQLSLLLIQVLETRL